MKITLIIISLLITTAINYVLFVPSSAVNLLISVFIKDDRTLMLLSDLAISNLIFWGLLSNALSINQKIKDKYSK
ncbi:MAG: hypothetical protein ACXVB0_14125 [Mucilaginibacter sp.]